MGYLVGKGSTRVPPQITDTRTHSLPQTSLGNSWQFESWEGAFPFRAQWGQGPSQQPASCWDSQDSIISLTMTRYLSSVSLTHVNALESCGLFF